MNKTVAESLDLANGSSGTQGSEGSGHCHLPAVYRTERSFQGGHRFQHPPRRTEHEPERLRRHTGEIAAGMLKEFSTKYVILGHSERREYQRESDGLIAAKAKAAHEAGLKPIKQANNSRNAS